MTLQKFKTTTDTLTEKAMEIYYTGDFQTDYTGGYPTRMCWNGEKAWLELADVGITDNSKFQQMCADFGIRSCTNIADFNALLESLGDDAYSIGYLTEEYDLPFLNENTFRKHPLG